VNTMNNNPDPNHPDPIESNGRAPADETQETAAQDSVQQMSLFNAVTPDAMNPETSDEIENPATTELENTDVGQTEPMFANAEPESRSVEISDAFVPLGHRLIAAREARGWSREDVASRLRLPAQVVQSLEKGDYRNAAYSIYLRGYLTSYTRLLDLPRDLVDDELREHGQTPQLVTSSPISRSRYLFDRYSVSALYLILTGVIIVPAVLLAMRTTFEPNLSQFTPLDTPLNTTMRELAVPDRSLPNPSANPGAETTATTKPAPIDPSTNANSPLIASMAPFSASSSQISNEIPTAAAASAGKHTARLQLRDASWVEILAADGQKLDYGLMPAGTDRTYASDRALDVRLGNVAGATIDIDGAAVDLTPYRHANVAHFKLFTGDQVISRTE
jgi:cytoskeleton protein RodZ